MNKEFLIIYVIIFKLFLYIRKVENAHLYDTTFRAAHLFSMKSVHEHI